jgi:hypothetical protein
MRIRSSSGPLPPHPKAAVNKRPIINSFGALNITSRDIHVTVGERSAGSQTHQRSRSKSISSQQSKSVEAIANKFLRIQRDSSGQLAAFAELSELLGEPTAISQAARLAVDNASSV